MAELGETRNVQELPRRRGGRRRAWTFTFTTIGLLVAVAAVGGAAVLFTRARSEQAARVALDAADGHYAKALDVVAAVEPKIATVQLEDASTVGSEVASMTSSAVDDIERARRELTLAGEALRPLPESDAKAMYTSVLAETDAGLVAMLGMLDYLGRSGGVLQNLINGTRTFGEADRLVSEAISLENREQWAAARKAAARAVALYRRSEAAFALGHKQDPEAGLDDAGTYAARYRGIAQLVLRMADAGRSSDVDAYNALSEKVNESRAAAAAADPPASITDPGWSRGRLGTFGEEVTQHMRRADTLMEKTRRLIADRRYR